MHGNRVYVNAKCRFTSNTSLGNNVHFNGITIIGEGNVTIGDNFHSGAGCYIITQNHNYNNGMKLPYDETSITKDTIIGDNVWLGARVMLLPGVNIGEGAVIQAGAVVTKDIPPLALAGGNPANVFKHRDAEHYWTLKENKLFF
ncbi:hypothetical protein AGMMS49992_21090 [Clostridia bacterium]|nr:hypothetical protein AGMMS49992_21090 [Clostridia bacterium]